MVSTVKAWIWQCQDCLRECVPIRAESRCMCGHRLKEHVEGHKCSNKSCSCPKFTFIVAEGSWILRCRCKHKHIEHCPTSYACKKASCGCDGFHSPWVCNCDHPWASHQQIMVERQVLRLSDMLAMQQEAATQQPDGVGGPPDQALGMQEGQDTAAAAEQLAGMQLGAVASSSHSGTAQPAAASAAAGDQSGSSTDSSSQSRLAELKASRMHKPQQQQAPAGIAAVRRVSVESSTAVVAASDAAAAVSATSTAAVVQSGAGALTFVEGELHTEVNRWDLLQRGRLS